MEALLDIHHAKEYDPTIKFPVRIKNSLLKKFIQAEKYSRTKLYDSMYAGKTILFSDYPLKLIQQKNEDLQATLIRMLKDGLPENDNIRIRAGSSRTIHWITIDEIIERWLRGRSKFGVTDLHFRGTEFYKHIDTDSISYFNLLPHCRPDVSFLEMLTLVISSKGIFSDSHSDDGDGSNHCFTGKKLWFAWDRIEGQKKGLQDNTYDGVRKQAKFDLETFASLKSSHWFTVSQNQTLFMPGNFTHKVITLEPYIGFGSFYLTLPNYFNVFRRWSLLPTEYVDDGFLESMTSDTLKKIKSISTLSDIKKNKWGFNYFLKAAKKWRDGLSDSQISVLAENSNFNKVLEFASKKA